MNFDALHHPYSSRRMTVYGNRGMIATSHPLAAQAGLEILRQGGNAIDAAIATAATLTVVEPTSNGIGGDAFALVWTKGRLHGLNASGGAPHRLTLDEVRRGGHEAMPKFGWLPVTVPGVPGAWRALSQKFGSCPFADLFVPAVEYAERGYPVSPIVAKYWARAYDVYRQNLSGDVFSEWFATFAPDGRAPRAGEIWRSQAMAKTLADIASTGSASFYRGRLSEIIDTFSRQTGGYLRQQDLAAFEPEWVDPIRVNYRGYEIWEIPPNGQGLVALMALNLLKEFDFDESNLADVLHIQMEAVKLAFADGHHYITDPSTMQMRVDDLLSDAYAMDRRSQIGKMASLPVPGNPKGSGTVYLATADAAGNMVSYIQSNYMGFGSGIVVPGTGIALQNRGHGFSLDPNHANVLAPGKRTFHTIIPGFMTKDGQAVGPFGVMGGYMQPQGHVQVVMNTVDFHLNPQAALDAPRWQWVADKKIHLEATMPSHVADELSARGHEVSVSADAGEFGRGQIIWRDEHGVLAGGTDPRADGAVTAW